MKTVFKRLNYERQILDDLIHGKAQCFNCRDMMRLIRIERILDKAERLKEIKHTQNVIEHFMGLGELVIGEMNK